MRLNVIGAGGHAKVALEAWRSSGGEIAALYDDNADLVGSELLGAEIRGPTSEAAEADGFVHIAVGDNGRRAALAKLFSDERCPLVRHAAAHISPTALIGSGTLVCAGAVIQAEARTGRHVIVNSQALVEHDVVIGDFAHIAPGARLAGGVRVGSGALIGIGAVLLPGIVIGERAVVGGGAVVTRDVPARAVVAGNPARSIRR